MNPHVRSRLLAVCGWCVLAAGIEVALYVFYFAHEARFHWFTHFFAGGALALLVMTVIAWRTRRPVPYPLVWPILGHLVAMFPDFLFEAGIAHRRWMDVFLGHLSIHFVPGRNWTWYGIFLLSLAVYLWVIGRRVLMVASSSPKSASPSRGQETTGGNAASRRRTASIRSLFRPQAGDGQGARVT